MEWRDEGLVIGVRRYGETSVIVELMTRHHGRHLGLVRGGRSRAMRPVLQPGNRVEAVWRARIEDHLGTFAVEATVMRAAALMAAAESLHGLNWLGHLLRLLPEREAHNAVFEASLTIVDHLDQSTIGQAMMVRLELALLAELGVGLALDRCAATGRRDDLAYVSPRTGRAVSREAGAPFRDRLLGYPPFLQADWDGEAIQRADIAQGFRLTHHFLVRDIFGPRGLPFPDARYAYAASVE